MKFDEWLSYLHSYKILLSYTLYYSQYNKLLILKYKQNSHLTYSTSNYRTTWVGCLKILVPKHEVLPLAGGKYMATQRVWKCFCHSRLCLLRSS